MKSILKELLMSERTVSQAEAFVSRPANALLISGPTGSGKSKLANYIAGLLLETAPNKLENHPHLIFISKPDNKAEIPIEAVRDLNKKMDLKVASYSNNPINRVAIIENSQDLSIEAQSALLKLLEEPPTSSLIILTADSDASLLPTVASRAQKISVTPPTLAQTQDYFSDYPKTAVESAYRLSRGASSLLEALLSDQDEHSLKIGVAQAKSFIASDRYSRLIQIQLLSKDKPAFVIFLDALSRVLAALNEENVMRRRQAASGKILATRKAVELAANQVQNNANLRLVALSLMQNTKI